MWPRVVEVHLAIWLMISPFVLRYPAPATDRFLWVNDYVCATVIAVCSLLSFWPRVEKLHLINLAVAAWLITVAYLRSQPPIAPPYQNYAVVALMLLVFAILPSHASEPPRKWKEFYGDNWGNL